MTTATGTTIDSLLDAASSRKIFQYSIVGDASVAVTEMTHDSARVTAGSLFVCVAGKQFDGHDFAAQAIAAGATALLVEHELPVDCTQIIVSNTRQVQGVIAAALWGFPAEQLVMVAVTGTNGKTTTSHLLGSILKQHGLNVQVIGTLTNARTTVESTDLHRQLYQFVTEGVDAVVMEVTSHAMVLHRVDGVVFNLAIFTNLSPEHLDFHGTMEKYFVAKAALFAPEHSQMAVVNGDDVHGKLISDTTSIPCVSFFNSTISEVAVLAGSHEYTWNGQSIHVNIGGKFNVSNSLAAVTAAVQLGVAETDIVKGLAAAETVSGRFEKVSAPGQIDVVVDYAHTPDALQRVLMSARDVVGHDHRVLVVFGCGGERDVEKRPLMGAIAAKFADSVFVTSDNPRSEKPDVIIQNIIDGIGRLPANTVVVAESDRRLAIGLALRSAQQGDIVVVAGKGHETYQTIGNSLLPFNDAQVVRELLEVSG
jgi:UDP-N-acetylmuramoyl-L-alanyl-D-glutamate--2,6-diaminopimelate ligase